MAPEDMRGEGAGQLLGRTVEASAVESLATGGGLAALMAIADLAASAFVLGATAGILPAVVLLLATAAGCGAGLAYWRARLAWTDHRLGLTHDLVERMNGHRTRLAQEGQGQWHRGEDEELVRYVGASRALDRRWVVFGALLPAAWLAAGLSSIVPSLVASTTLATSIAVAVGGVLLAFRALQKLTSGARGVVGALIAWRRVRPLFEAGGRTENAPPPEPWTASGRTENALPLQPGTAGVAPEGDHVVLTAENLVFRYRASGEPVLRGCSVRIRSRDRVLLEGPSGGGKSTLAMVLAGVRTPESGTLLARGLDRHTLGSEDWRRRVVTVPQFHENHVLSATFGFNVLMGRGWPPREQDLKEAEDVCQELGLGDLLARMPAGLQQIVGETGWQLSHGERSRLYIARALLQSPDVLVLDESFAALDPRTMLLCLECVLRRAPAVVVVAHP
jgi:ATP-binding cassette subfamily B protein